MKMPRCMAAMAGMLLALTAGSQAASNLVIVVNSSLQPLIQTNLDQYVADVTAEGYTPTVRTWNTSAADQNEPAELRAYLQSVSNNLVGAVFIGDLPVAQYENFSDFNGATATFPFDLYYMDLAVTWADTNANNRVDGPSTSGINPRIWVSRIKCSGMTTFSGYNEAALVNRYLAKVHRYRQGELRLPDRAMLWADTDWNYYTASSCVGPAYPNTTRVSDLLSGIATDAIDWQSRYRHAYETEFFMCHSSESLHQPSGNIGYAEVAAADLARLFWNCWNCSSAKYTYGNYVAGVRLFTPKFGLVVVGSTKTGSMLSASPFYTYLSQGKSHGEAFRQWFASNYYDVSWHRGMVLLGDGTLRLGRFTHAAVPGNTAPTLSTFTNVVAQEDVTCGPVEFTVGDTTQPASNLLVWAHASTNNCLPACQISFGGSNENRTLSFISRANTTGITTVEVSVCDGILIGSNKFVVTMQPVNDLPACTFNSPHDNNDVFMAGSPLVLSVNVTDVDGNGTVTGVTFQVDGAPVTGLKQGGAATFTNITAALSAGTHTIEAFALDSAGATGATISRTVRVLAPLPAGLTSSLLGAPTYAGAAGVDGNTIVVAGAGEINSTNDAGRFAWCTMAGNADLITRVTSVELNENESKAGLMFRASLDSNAPCVYAKIKPSGPKARLQYRLAAGSNTVLATETANLSLPRWLRLTKSNDVFRAYQGTDGVSWTLIGTCTNAMPVTFYAGLATAGYVANELCTATYENTALEQDFDSDGLLDSVDPDDDNDGLPDEWELANGMNPLASDAQTDADGDGLTAAQEYHAGTCPTNALSCVVMTDCTPNPAMPEEFILRWQSVAGKTYTLQASTNLTAGFNITVGTGISATPPTNVYTDQVNGVSSRFYRIKVE